MWCDRIRDEIQGICQHHDVEQALRVGSLCHSTHRGAGLSSSPTHLYMRKTQSAPPPLGVAAAGTGPRESVVGHRGAHVLAPLPLSSVRQPAGARAQRRAQGFHSVEHQACILTMFLWRCESTRNARLNLQCNRPRADLAPCLLRAIIVSEPKFVALCRARPW